jgi:predicted transcriptional regulator
MNDRESFEATYLRDWEDPSQARDVRIWTLAHKAGRESMREEQQELLDALRVIAKMNPWKNSDFPHAIRVAQAAIDRHEGKK